MGFEQPFYQDNTVPLERVDIGLRQQCVHGLPA